jgi:hypothetical protein
MAPGVGNDAIRTISIAAILNLHEGPGVTMKRIDGGFGKLCLLLNITNPHPWEFAFLHQGKEVRDLTLFSISQEIVYLFHLQEGIRFHLGITSGHDDQGVRVGLESSPDHLPRLKISPMRDRTGVDDGDIHPLSKGGEGIAFLFQGVHESLRLELIHFAAKGGNRNGFHAFEIFYQQG